VPDTVSAHWSRRAAGMRNTSVIRPADACRTSPNAATRNPLALYEPSSSATRRRPAAHGRRRHGAAVTTAVEPARPPWQVGTKDPTHAGPAHATLAGQVWLPP